MESKVPGQVAGQDLGRSYLIQFFDLFSSSWHYNQTTYQHRNIQNDQFRNNIYVKT